MTTLPDAAVARFAEERRALITSEAENARAALREVLADDRIRTHGLTYSQWSVLAEAKRGLDSVLP